MTAIAIRSARPDESAALTALALRSKAVWGYSADFMERCRAALTVTPHVLRTQPSFVAECDGGVVGFCVLGPRPEGLEVALLFVEPAAIGTGAGTALYEHAVAAARATGHDALWIESDPGAEPFYLRRGARRVGEVASPVEAGRRLPLLVHALAGAAPDPDRT